MEQCHAWGVCAAGKQQTALCAGSAMQRSAVPVLLRYAVLPVVSTQWRCGQTRCTTAESQRVLLDFESRQGDIRKVCNSNKTLLPARHTHTHMYNPKPFMGAGSWVRRMAQCALQGTRG